MKWSNKRSNKCRTNSRWRYKILFSGVSVVCVSVFISVLFATNGLHHTFSLENGIPKIQFAQEVSKANALDVQAAASSFESAQAALDEVQKEYDAVMAKADSLTQQINDTTTKAFEAQTEMLKYQQALRDMATYEYRNSTMFNLISCVVQSATFDELIKNLDYSNAVMAYQAQLSKEQAQRKANFEEILDDLTQAYTDYESTIAQATEKHNQAAAVANAAAANLNAAQAEQIAQRAHDIGGDVPGGGGDTPTPTPTPGPDPEPEPEPTPGPSWNYGIASAYGGSSDPSTPNPGRTATGAICDDWSMGVAVPMSWPNYRANFNHTIKIRYNGMTVLATVNDCGYMGGGSRSLDLQPGVFKAFGFGTCRAWGLRGVEFIIL